MESLGRVVDPFATRQISHCPLWLPLTHPAPLGLDAMVQTWPRLRVSFRMPRLEHLPQVLPLSDPRLSLALPAGGGGARVARLAF